MSSSVSPQSSPTSRRSPKLRRWVIVVAGVLASLILFAVVRMQGRVTGQEFSPTHFQVRHFSFYEIPLIHVQITPIKRRDASPATATFIRQTSLIPKPVGKPATWHLISLTRGMTGTTPADAKLLHDQLALNVNGTDFWRQWSIDHQPRAKILWPVIQRLSERELYLLMPGLMEMALIDQPPEKFSRQIDGWLRSEYADLVKDMREAKRPELASQLLEEALTDYPDDTELMSLRQQTPADTPSDSSADQA